MEDKRPPAPWLKIWLAFAWAFICVTAGIVVSLSIIGIPIALLLFIIGCLPLANLISEYIKGGVEHEYRDHALKTNEPKPWEE